MTEEKKGATPIRKEPPEEMKGLGKRLGRAIKYRGMNNSDLARESGTSPDQISRTVRGLTLIGIEAHTVVRWAKALQISLDWLLMGRGPVDFDVPLIHDGSAGVDTAIDILLGRMEERGISVQVQRVPADKDGHD